MNSRDPACDVDSFKQFFNTILFCFYQCDYRIRGYRLALSAL